jgi:hypothetical protein
MPLLEQLSAAYDKHFEKERVVFLPSMWTLTTQDKPYKPKFKSKEELPAKRKHRLTEMDESRASKRQDPGI